MEKKGKRIESESGEIPLPEAMIQHVQFYLCGKEAARTTVLSKSWYAAWLTRPVLDLDYFKFPRESRPLFEEYAKKTMQRYQGLSLKIERFRLRMDRGCSWAHDLIVNAINIGATDVELYIFSHDFTLPKEVLGSQTLLRLSVSGCVVDGNFSRCSRIQSLSLSSLKLESDGIKDIISCCVLIQELSLCDCDGLTLSLVNLYELHKLMRLSLIYMDVDDTFFTDFSSRFPCLKDLAIVDCDGYTRIAIASTSLQTIHLTTTKESWRAEFDVPNIRKFTYSGSGSPSQLSIKGGLTEWELDLFLDCYCVHKTSWFLNLKESLTKFRLSRISLSLTFYGRDEFDIVDLPKPLVVESLVINAPSSLCEALLVQFFGIFRPKFLTLKSWSDVNAASFSTICGKFGLKKVKVNAFGKVGQPLMLEKLLDPSETSVNNQFIPCELIWD